MSTRVRCSLNYGGSRYATTKQAVAMAAALYRRNTGRYYLVKKGTTPLWKYLVEMVEKTPDWPEGAKLKIWREKRGMKKKVIPSAPQPATTTARFNLHPRERMTHRTPTHGVDEVPRTWRVEIPRAER